MAQQKLPQAIADLTAVLELDPAHVLAYLQRAKLALKSGRCAEAVADFGKVLALDSGKRDAHSGMPQATECAAALDRAAHARGAGRFDLATAALSDAMAEGRATAAPALLLERAQAFLQLPGEDNINSALADLARVLKQEPNNLNAWAQRGRALLLVVDFATGAWRVPGVRQPRAVFARASPAHSRPALHSLAHTRARNFDARQPSRRTSPGCGWTPSTRAARRATN